MTKPAAGAPWSLIGGRVVHPRSAAGAPTTEPASEHVCTPLDYPYCQVTPNGRYAVVLLSRDQLAWLDSRLGDEIWGGMGSDIRSEMRMALLRIKEHDLARAEAGT